MFWLWQRKEIYQKCSDVSFTYMWLSLSNSSTLSQKHLLNLLSSLCVTAILIWKSFFLALGGEKAEVMILALRNLNRKRRQSRQLITKDSVQELLSLLWSPSVIQIFTTPPSFPTSFSHSSILLVRQLAISLTFFTGSPSLQQAATISSTASGYTLLLLIIRLWKCRLIAVWVQSMRQSGVDRRASQSNRRSSVHFRYESSAQQASLVERVRDANPYTSVSSGSDDTVKTTNFFLNTKVDSSLSGFDVPIFNLAPEPNDSKKDTKNEQEQFWTFLEKFGRDSDSLSSQGINFQEEETVNPRSSTGHRIDSFSDNAVRKSEFGSKPQPQQRKENLIKEATEDEESRYAPHRIFPQTQTVAVQTQTSQRVFKPRVIRKEEEECKRLTFKKFREVEEEEQGRYPRRPTRECGRLKFWMNERIDYRRGGYWVQEK